MSGYPAFYGKLGAKGAWRMRWRYTEQLGLLRTAELSENDGVQDLVTNLSLAWAHDRALGKSTGKREEARRGARSMGRMRTSPGCAADMVEASSCAEQEERKASSVHK